MNNLDKENLINRYLTAYNTFDVEGMIALLSANIHFENYSSGQLTNSTNGIDEFRELAEQSKSLFSEREQRIIKLTFGQDSAVADIVYRGKLAVDIPNGPSAGTILDLKGQSEFYFVNGRIRKIVDRS